MQLLSKLKAKLMPNSGFVGSRDYWEQRYAAGGNSGSGSYNNLAQFKAEVINDFIRKNDVHSVIEYGCGDGNQLLYMQYPSYIGLDISKTAIGICKDKFKQDKTKSFFVYDTLACVDNHRVFSADLTLSLDVLYHLIEKDIFESYIKQLFASANRFVIIYSSDYDDKQVFHEKNRNFTGWVKENLPGWRLKEKIKNKFPEDKADPDHTSKADFFIYEIISK
jgi:cyclopropane fatty-acyl-phospholipid synthase-like methyltransferase